LLNRLYDRYLLPYLVDIATGFAPLERQRKNIVPKARGRVLEIGFGTGRNLPFYEPSRVTEIVGLEPAEPMRRLARKRIAKLGIEVRLLDAFAENIPYEDGSFDTVVMTFTLCSVLDPSAALLEMRRVLGQDGRLLFCEHGRSPHRSVNRWQKRLTPVWKKVAGGCHLDRDVGRLLEEAGFECLELERFYASPLRVWTWITRGEAVPSLRSFNPRPDPRAFCAGKGKSGGM